MFSLVGQGFIKKTLGESTESDTERFSPIQ